MRTIPSAARSSAPFPVDEVNGELVGSCGSIRTHRLPPRSRPCSAHIFRSVQRRLGRGFEQREIDVGDGKLYVHFWQDHDFELKRDVPDMTEFKNC
ncbi:hypothetical protein NIA69_02970 [Gemmiger formicilis]|nr:hypothetical protein [Gemmiger formicilis]